MPTEPSASTSLSWTGVDIRRFGWIRRLAGAYVHDFPSVAPFFVDNPAVPDAWRDALGRVQAYPRQREEIAGVLEAQQLRRGAPPEALAATARLRDTRTVAVVTGQQAGLFGGPLFTLLKSLTTISLAERTAREHDVPTVALFWVDAEDHDWDEVRACQVLDGELQPRLVELASPEGAGERPVGLLALDVGIEAALAVLDAALPPTEFTPEIRTLLRRCYRLGTGMAEAFARLLEAVLGPHGLIVFDASDPAAKSLAAEIFTRELRHPGHTAALAAAAGRELARRGHEPQIVPQPDSVALFCLDRGREPIRHRDGRFIIGEAVYDQAELASHALVHPERFSPNVLLRPIVQDTLFPTACYVAGPSELAYLGQLRGIYQHFGVPMPLVYPRAAATILDSASTRFLARYQVPIEDLHRQDESALNRLLESQLPPSVEQSFERALAAVRERMATIIKAVPLIDPTLAGATRTTLGRMEHDLHTLHSKIIQAAKRRDETLRRQFIRAQAQAFPGGHQQERALGFIYFLNRFGPALTERLLAGLPMDMGMHWIVTA